MEDILTATDLRLEKITSLEQVRRIQEYLINYPPDLENEITEIWEKLQVGILHRNSAVVAENIRAARMVRDLLLVYTIAPELVDPSFLESHRKLA